MGTRNVIVPTTGLRLKWALQDTATVTWRDMVRTARQPEMLSFRAPEAPDDYPYVCTFPGHWIRMNGVMHVVPADAELGALAAVDPVAESSRKLVANWKNTASHWNRKSRTARRN